MLKRVADKLALILKFLQCMLICWSFLDLEAGGICLYEISSADTRLASAGWSARAEDPSTVFTNPAGMTRLCGRQAELGAQAIFSHVHFEPNEETTVRGSDGHANIWLPSGSFFYVHPCNDRLTVGMGSLGYFGADLVYNHHWVGRYYVQKILLEGFSFVPATAYRINKQWSIGAGLNIMYGVLKQRSAVNNFTDRRPDGYLNFHDNRFGCGGIVGILYELNPCTRFGIQYLTPVKLDFRAKPKFHHLGPLLEEILTSIKVIGSKLDVHVNVPQSVMLSAYHDVNSCWSIMANVGWQQWSKFELVTITLADLNENSFRFTHDYLDTWHVAFGVEGYWSKCLLLSGGVAYDSEAISSFDRPLNFPIGSQWRVGTGARWFISDRLTIDFCSELQWQGDLKADVNKGPVAGHVSGMFKNTYVIFTNVNLTYLF